MLQQTIQSRNIKYLIHFTRIENLERILSEGLKAKDTLVTEGIPFLWNDAHRLDGRTNASCCSIGHPNYKMFYSLRCEHPGSEWVVLGIKPSILWEKNVAFCFTNAASSSITRLPLNSLKGVNAFNKLFDEVPGKPTRQTLGLAENFPTDPQAEILVFETIETEDIFGVVFQSSARRDEYKIRFSDKQVLYIPNFFSPRHDYQHWKSNSGI